MTDKNEVIEIKNVRTNLTGLAKILSFLASDANVGRDVDDYSVFILDSVNRDTSQVSHTSDRDAYNGYVVNLSGKPIPRGEYFSKAFQKLSKVLTEI